MEYSSLWILHCNFLNWLLIFNYNELGRLDTLTLRTSRGGGWSRVNLLALPCVDYHSSLALLGFSSKPKSCRDFPLGKWGGSRFNRGPFYNTFSTTFKWVCRVQGSNPTLALIKNIRISNNVLSLKMR